MGAAFDRQLIAFGASVEALAVRAIIALGKKAHLRIQLGTPIDTGRAIASWNASLNGANTRVQPPEFFVGGGDKPQAAKQGVVEIDDLQLGETIHIANALPYIFALNNGSSRQAPKNFVEIAVQSIRADTGKLF